jgi:hypothetical protein
MLSLNNGSSTICDVEKQKDQLRLYIAASESVKVLFKQQTLKKSKLVQLDKVLHT